MRRRLACSWLAFALASCGKPVDPSIALIAGAKRCVVHELRDPSSAQFRAISVYPGAICGEINQKNGFGGYVGFRKFSFSRGDGRVVIDEPFELGGVQLGGMMFDSYIADVCSPSGSVRYAPMHSLPPARGTACMLAPEGG